VSQFEEVPREDGACVVRVSGEVDLAVAAEFQEQVRGCLTRSARVELDLGGLTFIDSSGLGSLVLLQKEAAQQAKSLVLVNVNARVNRLLEVTGLQHTFDIRSPQG
jgi:anti-anti-sigma factor